MNIRLALEKDLEQIVVLCGEHAAYEKSSFDAKNKKELFLKHFLKFDNNLQCLVVEEEGSLLGYATFFKQFSTWDASFYVYLDCLFLKEKTRGKGMGFKIMEHIKAYAVAENCNEIQWQTPNFNTNAIRFYKKLGAESKSKERFFWEV